MNLKSKVEVSEKVPGVVEGVAGSAIPYTESIESGGKAPAFDYDSYNPITGRFEKIGDGVVTPDEVPPIFDASTAKLLLYAALTIFITSCLTGIVVGYLIGQPLR